MRPNKSHSMPYRFIHFLPREEDCFLEVDDAIPSCSMIEFELSPKYSLCRWKRVTGAAMVNLSEARDARIDDDYHHCITSSFSLIIPLITMIAIAPSTTMDNITSTIVYFFESLCLFMIRPTYRNRASEKGIGHFSSCIILLTASTAPKQLRSEPIIVFIVNATPLQYVYLIETSIQVMGRRRKG